MDIVWNLLWVTNEADYENVSSEQGMFMLAWLGRTTVVTVASKYEAKVLLEKGNIDGVIIFNAYIPMMPRNESELPYGLNVAALCQKLGVPFVFCLEFELVEVRKLWLIQLCELFNWPIKINFRQAWKYLREKITASKSE